LQNKDLYLNFAAKIKKQMRTLLLFVFTFAAFTFSAAAQEKLKADGEMPIVAWFGIPPHLTGVERFREMKESGVNTSIMPFYSSIEDAERAMDTAYKAGVKIVVSCPELDAEPEKAVARLMKHSALAGYYIRDEPGAKEFPALGERVRRIQTVDKQHYCYINLFPNYAAEHLLGTAEKQLGKSSYEDYLNEYLKHVPVPFISFDNYPVKKIDGVYSIRGNWYENLEAVLAASRRSGLPVWAFALSTPHGQYPAPTVADLRLQMYSNLAYGAQGLQYFQYQYPGDMPEGFFNQYWKRNDTYDRAKLVNSEIHNLSGVFLGAVVVDVWHTGKEIPGHTRRLETLPDKVKRLDTGDSGAVVSLLKKGNRRSLVIVNRSITDMMKLTFVADGDVKRVLKDGTLVPASAYADTMEVEPGDAMIYTWKNVE
jgi:hypothetical protein